MSDFWARRKAAVAAEAKAEQDALEATEQAEHDALLARKSDAEILEELGLPDPDQVEDSAEIQKFLTDQIPARLKNRALRRLWRLNPVLANLDGLIDYGEDFTDGANVIENLQTAYQVGKGMAAHVEALAKQAEADAQAPEEDPGPDPEVIATQTEADAPASDEDSAPDPFHDDEPTVPTPRRRMRIVFDDDNKEMA